MGKCTLVMPCLCRVSLPLLNNVCRWSRLLCEPHLFLNHVKGDGFPRNRRTGFCSSCLSHWRCSTCVFLFRCSRFMCSTSLVLSGAVFLGFVSQLIRHPYNVPTVCGAVFTHHTLARRLLERNISCQSRGHCVPPWQAWQTELVMLQGLGWRLTMQEVLHSSRWDYVVSYSVEGSFL